MSLGASRPNLLITKLGPLITRPIIQLSCQHQTSRIRPGQRRPYPLKASTFDGVLACSGRPGVLPKGPGSVDGYTCTKNPSRAACLSHLSTPSVFDAEAGTGKEISLSTVSGPRQGVSGRVAIRHLLISHDLGHFGRPGLEGLELGT